MEEEPLIERVLDEVRTNPVLFDEAYKVSRISELHRRGYRLHQDVIETPSGQMMTPLQAKNWLAPPLRVGYLPQIEALAVLEYFQLLKEC